jgi:hypothetical protein
LSTNGADSDADSDNYDSGVNDFLSEILKSNKLSEILKSSKIEDVISSSTAGPGGGIGSSTVANSSAEPPQPPPGGITKSDLYGDDELASLLQMHQRSKIKILKTSQYLIVCMISSFKQLGKLKLKLNLNLTLGLIL